jgi:hypothetical protein
MKALGEVKDDESISHYIFDKKEFDQNKGIVLTVAFMPRIAPGRTQLETSVFRVQGLSEDENWSFGEWVSIRRKRSLKGRGDLKVKDTTTLALQVIAETSLHDHHADIVGWSEDEVDQLYCAAELAQSATLVLPRTPKN